jgi:hypothetical protein
VGIGKHLPCVGAGGLAGGSARRVVPGRGDRLVEDKSLSTSCSSSVSIKNSKDIPLASDD